ncbi:Hypothetical protein I595_95 [Croceitalea dokdonensis DOKDO 023]|uniref:Uncharacterized protein n=1 Tax=Croceitalea dokdonensis DOKDO 023 TaxID=1300341 RepID=A0A0P7AHX2_9FLAO|nr:hypothetical protein [Croceitalea dokdonensis]KPM33193.1 Hypothetical protein I595_95 [Croceitalea dokdonensis DOKDO 023]
MKNHLYLAFILMAVLGHTHHGTAQKKGYQEGYIITLERDTISGWVKDRTVDEPVLELYERIYFRSTKPKSKKRYRAKELLGYGYDNDHFESVPLKESADFFTFSYELSPTNDHMFLKRIAKNQFIAYYEKEFVDVDQSYYSAYPLLHKAESDTMVRATQGFLGLKRKQLMQYFKDCPKLIAELKIKSFKDTGDVFEYYSKNCPK